MIYALIANGIISDKKKIAQKIKTYDVLIAVDGGLNFCETKQLKPSLIIGDMDSADPKLLEKYSDVEQIRHPRDKNKTDLELSVEYVFAKNPDLVTIFGGTGLRTDHIVSNLMLLSRFPEKLKLESETETLFVLKKKIAFKTIVGQTISLIPLNGCVEGITTQGLKWELCQRSLDKNFIGISNEALSDQVEIEITKGDLLIDIIGG